MAVKCKSKSCFIPLNVLRNRPQNSQLTPPLFRPHSLNVDVDEELFVDTSRNEKMRINIDIEFPKMPCAYLSLDVMDVSGTAFDPHFILTLSTEILFLFPVSSSPQAKQNWMLIMI